MTISNHVLVASLIAVTIKEPALVLPLAFLSHYVLDALPHYGYPGHGGYGEAFKHKATFIMESFNFIGIIILLFTIHFSVWVVTAAIILSILPDIEWPYRYIFFERKSLKPPDTITARFHQKIQWCERWWGIYSEVGFFIIFYIIFLKYNG
ncbi:MAG TPA: hypothetical protein VMR76_01035 [Candidatus Saccharimonadia bacterium]|nr:hypothetical protein [Candidatus Saccharimonadia bacterium]